MPFLFPDSPLPLVHHVQPAPSPTPRAERPIPTGLHLVDDAVGGVVPGALLVITALSAEIRRTVAAALAVIVAQERGEPVLLASADLQGQDLVTRTFTAARGGFVAATAMARTGARIHLKTTPRVAIAADTPDAAALAARIRELEAPPRLVVVLDPDRDGTLPGEAPRQAFRQLAGTLGVPVVLIVAGAAPGWADPRDAHVGLVRTHGGQTERFLVRGVPACSAETPRFEAAITPERVRVRRLPASHVLLPEGREARWSAERDFDGVRRTRPTAVTLQELLALLADPEGGPQDADHALRVALAIAAAHRHGDDRDALLGGGPERVVALLLRAAAVAGRNAAELWDQVGSHLGRRPGPQPTSTTDALLGAALAQKQAERERTAEAFREEAPRGRREAADAAQQRLPFERSGRDAPAGAARGEADPALSWELREERMRERELRLRERERELRWLQREVMQREDRMAAERARLRAARVRRDDERMEEEGPEYEARLAAEIEAIHAARREREAGRRGGPAGLPGQSEPSEPRRGYNLEALRRAMRAGASGPQAEARRPRQEEE